MGTSVVLRITGTACLIAAKSALSAVAAPPAPTGPAISVSGTSLSADLSKGITSPAPSEAVWNFGKRQVAAGDTIERVFVLHNRTKAAITLDALLTSCHCTTATVLRPGTTIAEDPPYTLAPGRSVAIRVTIDVDTAHAVELRKMVWVYVRGRDEAAFTFTVSGTLTAANGS